MAAHQDSTTATAKSELILTRIIDAPRDQVFSAWTDPEQVARWWGPDCFTNPVCEVDARPGGALYIEMQGPDGTVHPCPGDFREVVRPSRLVFTTGALERRGGDLIVQVLNTVTFEEMGRKTKVTLHAVPLKVTAAGEKHIKGMAEGWSQSLERMATHVTGV